MKKMSVIIAVYNVNIYVEKCIQSVCSNDYENLEIIVVDDGSTDGSGDICDKCAEEDNRVIVIHKTNGGTVTARKMGLAISSGDCIAFVDGDDWVESDMYSSMMKKMDETDCDIVLTGMFREQNGNVYVEWKPSSFQEGFYDGKLLVDIKRHLFDKGVNRISGSCVNKLYKRQIIAPLIMQMDNENFGVDDDNFALAAILSAKSLYIWNKSFYHGIERAESAVHSLHSDYYYKMHLTRQHYINMLSEFQDDDFSYSVKQMFLYRLQLGITHIFGDVFFPFYLWRDAALFKNKKIILYAGGNVGEAYHQQIKATGDIQLVCWIDKYQKYSRITGTPLNTLDKLNEYEYDAIVLAVEDQQISLQIKRELMLQEVPDDKIVWSEPIYITDLLMKKNKKAVRTKSLQEYTC